MRSIKLLVKALLLLSSLSNINAALHDDDVLYTERDEQLPSGSLDDVSKKESGYSLVKTPPRDARQSYEFFTPTDRPIVEATYPFTKVLKHKASSRTVDSPPLSTSRLNRVARTLVFGSPSKDTAYDRPKLLPNRDDLLPLFDGVQERQRGGGQLTPDSLSDRELDTPTVERASRLAPYSRLFQDTVEDSEGLGLSRTLNPVPYHDSSTSTELAQASEPSERYDTSSFHFTNLVLVPFVQYLLCIHRWLTIQDLIQNALKYWQETLAAVTMSLVYCLAKAEASKSLLLSPFDHESLTLLILVSQMSAFALTASAMVQKIILYFFSYSHPALFFMISGLCCSSLSQYFKYFKLFELLFFVISQTLRCYLFLHPLFSPCIC